MVVVMRGERRERGERGERDPMDSTCLTLKVCVRECV